MKLGAFSISLAVKDLKKSKEFYENLGFKRFAGELEQKWLILKNEITIIGLFEDMLQENSLTFNPGWDENARNVEPFDDIRTIQHHLKNCGVTLTTETDLTTQGPGHISLKDPDGNVILIDQHR